jgi:hypothetical protein
MDAVVHVGRFKLRCLCFEARNMVRTEQIRENHVAFDLKLLDALTERELAPVAVIYARRSNH